MAARDSGGAEPKVLLEVQGERRYSSNHGENPQIDPSVARAEVLVEPVPGADSHRNAPPLLAFRQSSSQQPGNSVPGGSGRSHDASGKSV